MAKSKRSAKKADSQASPEHQPEGQASPDEMNDRRAEISKKARAKRTKQVEDAAEEVEGAEEANELAKMAEEQGLDVRTHGEERKPDSDDDSGGDKSASGEDDSGQESVDSDLREVVIYGRTYKVPQKDIDRAGGVEAYQRTRAANIRMEEAAKIEQRLEKRKQDLQRREQEIAERERKAKEAEKSHEQPSAKTGPEGQEPPDKGAQQKREDGERPDASREDRVKNIVKRMYSGKEEDAAAAVEEILSSAENRPQLSPEAVAKMVLQQLDEQKQQQEKERRQEYEERQKVTEESHRRRVNDVMANEYGDVLKNEDKLVIARNRFEKLKGDPTNANRDPEDLAREAGEYARQVRVEPVSKEISRREREKQEMARESSASGKAADASEKKVPSPKSHIERLRKRAGIS